MDMKHTQNLVRSIGVVRSLLRSRQGCPKQGQEGAPDAWLEIDTALTDGFERVSSIHHLPEQKLHTDWSALPGCLDDKVRPGSLRTTTGCRALLYHLLSAM